MKRNDEILSLEQVRVMLHISKRKASWMLRNQIIPCEVKAKKTRTFAVRREDVEAFLRLPLSEQKARIPTGRFTSGCQYKPVSRVYVYTIPDAERDRFTQYLIDLFSDKPEALTINAACSMTGYCATTLNRWIDAGVLFAARLFDGPRIPKSSLVSFLASDSAFRIHQKSEVHTELIERWMDREE
jgi:hypothetical protein